MTCLGLPDRSFDAAVAAFLFRVLPDGLQVPALRELGRAVRPGGTIRLLEHVRPRGAGAVPARCRRGAVRRVTARPWEPRIAWAYGAGFDRRAEEHIPEAGLTPVEARLVVDHLMKLITARTTKGDAAAPLLEVTL